MKAAVLHTFGGVPRFEDFPEPTPQDDEILVHVKAVALENIDRMVAAGSHFATHQFIPKLPAILASDGIGEVEGGALIGFAGMRPPYGAMAEIAAIPKSHQVSVPAGFDAATLAAVPGAALTSLFPLKWGVKLEPGENVLINGATGFAGKLAVQIAKLLGAKRVVGTGRDEEALQSLFDIGADAVIDLKQADDKIVKDFQAEAQESGYQIILDFLWGHPTELLLESLVPQQLSFAKSRIVLVQIGEMAGSKTSLPAGALRTSGLEIVGAARGLSLEAFSEGTDLLWKWLRAGKLHAEIEQVPLSAIEEAWQRKDLHGKRIVIVPG